MVSLNIINSSLVHYYTNSPLLPDGNIHSNTLLHGFESILDVFGDSILSPYVSECLDKLPPVQIVWAAKVVIVDSLVDLFDIFLDGDHFFQPLAVGFGALRLEAHAVLVPTCNVKTVLHCLGLFV